MSAYSDAVLADAPTWYYRLDEGSGSVADQNGANLLAVQHTPVYGLPSLIPSDRADSSIGFVAAATDQFQATLAGADYVGDLTVEAWVSVATLPASAARIVASTGLGRGWLVGVKSTGVWRFTTAGVKDYDFTAAPALGSVSHVVFVYDNTTFSVDLFVNGSFQQRIAGVAGMGVSAAAFHIGAGQGVEYWDGTIDDVAVYKSKLSASRVAAHWNIGTQALPHGGQFAQAGVPALASHRFAAA